MNNYKATIGIEVHAELKTNTKVFSKAQNSYHALVNTASSIVDLGYPGVLPIVNQEVINKALLAALALNCHINETMHFDRKNYFYPDLPKGYQITQSRTPIGYDGYLTIYNKEIGIERLHIEEDTCKSLHDNEKTLLNYNRAGVPLIEIVTKPVISSGEEAMLYLERLKELLFYLDISDCKMEEGSMRADVNVSVSKDEKLGTKCEVKNIGSIKDVGIAINYEIKRQIAKLEKGEQIIEETRKFDAKTNTTILMRVKEVGNDYRYFPEPDIPYLYLTFEEINKTKEKLYLLPDERRSIYLNKGIIEINVEKLIGNKKISDYLNNFLDTNINFKIASNLLLGDISSYLNKNKEDLTNTKLTKEKFIELVTMLDENIISSRICKDILKDILTLDLSIKEILEKNNISLLSNQDELTAIIKDVLKENPDSVKDYQNGKENAFKYLMGMVMKKTKGSANPQSVNAILTNLLSNNVNWLLTSFHV